MEIFRVIYKDGSWLDIEAWQMEPVDGYIWFWKDIKNKPVAIVPVRNVWAVALKDQIKDRNFIPDCAGHMTEVREPIDFSQPCWPDRPTEEA